LTESIATPSSLQGIIVQESARLGACTLHKYVIRLILYSVLQHSSNNFRVFAVWI